MTEKPEFFPTTTSYEAEPGDVHRVCLLYSGGLDTSVMLKYIQDVYEAEVVALTVNLGQPGEDYEVIEGKARRLGAVDARVIDARDVFAQGLGVEIGCGVDQHNLAAELDHHRGPRAFVVRIGRVADRAVAAQRGHAHRRAAA